ncbi:MarR family winged helix-turn-helix transcriptional regulator [Paenibacillus sp. PL91]|uniref:MarR family winged helix-turn-helix transcriptional regulator n=1 Tax=Paenibacillus sp. PL91 TaxID=2729538 RepID=UPI00165915AE|nr:MarR family transcriptional regulator [Paenibacillus sp. PL91]MBC9199287.1 MarR family transcriptional regulator [Paenibacillus sp. PL91]
MRMNEHKSINESRERLEIELGEQLNALISSAHALNVKAAAKFDSSIQPAAFHIVRWLYSYGATNAAALAESTAMDRSSVSRLVKQLQALGYVKREASPNDGRGVVLSLTEYGQQKIIDALKEKESVYYERLSDWKDAELHDFIQMLRHFNGFRC